MTGAEPVAGPSTTYPPVWDRVATIVVVVASVPIALYMFVGAFFFGGMEIGANLMQRGSYNAVLVEAFRLGSAFIPLGLIVCGDVFGLRALGRARRGIWYALGGLVAGAAVWFGFIALSNL